MRILENMNKNNLVYVLLISLGFLFFVIGSILLITGCMLVKNEIVYFGIVSLIIGVVFYIVVGGIILARFLRKRG